MGRQDGVKGIRQKKVCVLMIGLIYIYYLMYFDYLLLFIIHVLSLYKLRDLLMHLSLSMMRYTSGKLAYACQTVGSRIGR